MVNLQSASNMHNVADASRRAGAQSYGRGGMRAHKEGERRGRVREALKLLVKLQRLEARLRLCRFRQQRLQDPADLVLGQPLEPYACRACASRTFIKTYPRRLQEGELLQSVTDRQSQWRTGHVKSSADLLRSASCRICRAAGAVLSPGLGNRKPSLSPHLFQQKRTVQSPCR